VLVPRLRNGEGASQRPREQSAQEALLLLGTAGFANGGSELRDIGGVGPARDRVPELFAHQHLIDHAEAEPADGLGDR
jgi:hypothetical protein